MFKKTVVIFVAIFLVFGTANAYGYDRNAATKLGRGLANAVTCWIELPKQIWMVSKEREPFTGLVYGSAKGLCYTAIRLVSGAYDTATFLIPPYDKALNESEFVFEGWDE